MNKRKIAILLAVCTVVLSGCANRTHVPEKGATCTQAGNVEYWTDGEHRYIGASGEEELTFTDLPPIGHDCYESHYPATCIKEGERLLACRRCGYTEVQTLPKTEHVFYGERVIKAATCVEAGEKARFCAVCGASEKSALPALGHKFQMDNSCLRCSFLAPESAGVSYTLVTENGRETGYLVSGFSLGETELFLPVYHNGLPVCGIANGAFSGNDRLLHISCLAELKTIGANAFRNCSALCEIIVPDSVTAVGNYAFYNCASAKSLYLGKNVSEIGLSAFLLHSGNALEQITVGEGNPVFYAERGCLIEREKLILGCNTAAEVPAGITEIAPYAFYALKAPGRLTIPKSVVKIGDFAFCESGTLSLFYDGTVAEWEKVEKGARIFGGSVHCADGDVFTE